MRTKADARDGGGELKDKCDGGRFLRVACGSCAAAESDCASGEGCGQARFYDWLGDLPTVLGGSWAKELQARARGVKTRQVNIGKRGHSAALLI
jgi:hypothetical protein